MKKNIYNRDIFNSYSIIKIICVGKVLFDYHKKSKKFLYRNAKLSDIIYGVYAMEDIYLGNKIIYYKNMLIEQLKVKNGVVFSSKLPNGKYYIKEIKTIYGFILNKKSIEVNLYNKNDYVFIKNIYFVCNRKKYCFDFQLFQFKNKDNIFYLYNGFDIYNYFNKLLIKKNSLIYVLNFKISNNIKIYDLSYGLYYIKDKFGNIVYEFSINNSYNDEVYITKEPINNNINKVLIKNNFDLIKMNYKYTFFLLVNNSFTFLKKIDIFDDFNFVDLDSDNYSLYFMSLCHDNISFDKICDFVFFKADNFIKIIYYDSFSSFFSLGCCFDDFSICISYDY